MAHGRLYGRGGTCSRFILAFSGKHGSHATSRNLAPVTALDACGRGILLGDRTPHLMATNGLLHLSGRGILLGHRTPHLMATNGLLHLSGRGILLEQFGARPCPPRRALDVGGSVLALDVVADLEVDLRETTVAHA